MEERLIDCNPRPAKETQWWATPRFLVVWGGLSAAVVFVSVGTFLGLFFSPRAQAKRGEEQRGSEGVKTTSARVLKVLPSPRLVAVLARAGTCSGKRPDQEAVSPSGLGDQAGSGKGGGTQARNTSGSASGSASGSTPGSTPATAPRAGAGGRGHGWGSYFPCKEGEELRYRLAVKDWKGAEALLRRWSKDPAKEPKAVRFLLAHVLIKAGRWGQALPHLLWLKTRWKLMRSRLAVMEALCHARLKDYKKAAAVARKVKKGEASWVTAQLVLGASLRKSGEWRKARKVYVDFLNSSPPRGIAEARLRLAECLRKTGGALGKILTQLRLVRRDYPASRTARKAAKLKKKVLAKASQAVRRRWSVLPCSFAVERAHRLMKASRYTQARKELRGVLRRVKSCSAKDRCKAAYDYAQCYYKVRKRKRSAPLFERAVRWCDRGGTATLRVKAKYQAARSNRYRLRFVRARNYFRRVEREHPNHSYADDARLRLAETWKLDKRPKLAKKTYETLVKKYPKGDMRGEAHWRLVRTAYFKGNLKESLRLLQWGAKVLGPEEGPNEEGRLAYWTGRVLQKLGRKEKAKAAYEKVARKHPLSYYAWLATGRLASLDRQRLLKLQNKWQGKTGGSGGAAGRKGSRGRKGSKGRKGSRGRKGSKGLLRALRTDPVFSKPGFSRAVALARMGLGRQALAELRSVGIRVYRGSPYKARKIKVSAKRRNRLWAASVLLDAAGLYHLSHWTPRHLLDEFRQKPPKGTNRRRWLLAFPRAYAPLVRRAARRFGVPTALLFGIMREESAFNPRQVSRVKAVGLTQLLLSTAKRFARGMGVKVSYRSLKRAEINVPIGARYLGYLLKSFKNRKPLAVASYNAGENRLVRWVKKRRKLEIDEFVELIPFDQTRKYTKRVLGSAFAYRYFEKPSDPFLKVAFALPSPHLGRIPPLPSRRRQRPSASLATRED